MIERGFELCSCIILFYKKHGQQLRNACNCESSCHADILNYKDWQILSDIYLILKLFWDFTKHIESYKKTGTHSVLWKVLIGIESMS